MKAGILTGGGDCPALNAVIRAVTFKLEKAGSTVIGFLDGWAGVLENKTMPLSRASTQHILHLGGTVLGTSRTNPFKKADKDVPRLLATLKDQKLDALVAVGGDDTLGVATKLFYDHKVNVVGVPKTIDNDLSGTDYTFGFDTAVTIATEAIDRLHTTAESHNRVMVVEVMGRHAGWIAVMSGIAGGADVILIPEQPVDFDEVAETIRKRHARGKNFSIVVASEGCELPGFEDRVTVLGHVQRGGTPTARDRVLATRYGLKAAELAHTGQFGQMAALRGDDIVAVSLAEATAELKTVPPAWYEVAQSFFG
jgi:ATP-dependent phosphofructokinase / diphosphate-dependent phosphofructokinase